EQEFPPADQQRPLRSPLWLATGRSPPGPFGRPDDLDRNGISIVPASLLAFAAPSDSHHRRSLRLPPHQYRQWRRRFPKGSKIPAWICRDDPARFCLESSALARGDLLRPPYGIAWIPASPECCGLESPLAARLSHPIAAWFLAVDLQETARCLWSGLHVLVNFHR